MNIAVLRSIPLAKDTREAWAAAGVRVIPRKLIDHYVEGRRTDDDTIFINLGIRRNIRQEHVINPLEVVQSVSRPTDIRKTLNEFLPPPPEEGEAAWIKRHGYGGSGSAKIEAFRTGQRSLRREADEYYGYVDYQRHVLGTEYRVNTIGNVIVQAHMKEGHENWEWVGVQGVKSNGVIPLLKAAIEAVPYGDRSFIGWDVIVGTDKPYIIEANTSPGVNESTARRVVDCLMASYDSEPVKVH